MSGHYHQNFDEPNDRNHSLQSGEEERWIVDQLRTVIQGLDAQPSSIWIEPFRGLLKIYTSDGLFFFKSLRGIHKHEQKLTCALARLHPAKLPEVISADNERAWLLMRDVKGSLLDNLYETKHFEEAIGHFAWLQIECIKQADVLLACGCPDYRLESIAVNIAGFFEYLSAWEVNNEEADSIRKQVDFPILVERLAERCERVREDCIPPTLCHGDLNLGNIFAGCDRYIFIDWAEGYVGHPFFTPLEYFNIVKRDRGIEMANIPALRLAYLKPWSETLQLDTDHLVKLLDLSRPLGMLRIAMRLVEYYMNLESIRENQEATAIYVMQVWEMVKRMNNILSRGETLAPSH
jgi:hypothetical protein